MQIALPKIVPRVRIVMQFQYDFEPGHRRFAVHRFEFLVDFRRE